MPSLHPCMFLLLNSVSTLLLLEQCCLMISTPHDSSIDTGMVRLQATFFFYSITESDCHALASDPVFISKSRQVGLRSGILFVFPESIIFIDALMTAHLFHLPKNPQQSQVNHPKNPEKPGSNTKKKRSLRKITPLAAPQSSLALQRPSPTTWRPPRAFPSREITALPVCFKTYWLLPDIAFFGRFG